MSDATKAMQQLNGLDIGGTAISVKIAAISADMAGLAGLNLPTLDDDEGTALSYSQQAHSSCIQQRASLMLRPLFWRPLLHFCMQQKWDMVSLHPDICKASVPTCLAETNEAHFLLTSVDY